MKPFSFFHIIYIAFLIQVTVRNTADWWLGDPETEYFKAAEKAIEMVGCSPPRLTHMIAIMI